MTSRVRRRIMAPWELARRLTTARWHPLLRSRRVDRPSAHTRTSNVTSTTLHARTSMRWDTRTRTGRTWSALQARGRQRRTTRASPQGAIVSWTLLAEDERVMTEGDAIVYVVDDDASLRASLQDLLESVGLRV